MNNSYVLGSNMNNTHVMDPIYSNAPATPVMNDLAKTLADLAEKATPEPWEVEVDPYGELFPGITEAGSSFELASFTAGERGDENQANAFLSVELVNNLPAIIAALIAQAEYDRVLAERDGLRASVAILNKQCEEIQAKYDTLKAENVQLQESYGILENALRDAGDDHPDMIFQEWCEKKIKSARPAAVGQVIKTFKADPSPWIPITDLVTLKHLGKLSEELSECGAAVARCIIQGVDECEPSTGEPNRLWLQKELADVLCNIELVTTHLNLDAEAIATRVAFKADHLKRWHAMGSAFQEAKS